MYRSVFSFTNKQQSALLSSLQLCCLVFTYYGIISLAELSVFSEELSNVTFSLNKLKYIIIFPL